jgi:hypothetical protein
MTTSPATAALTDTTAALVSLARQIMKTRDAEGTMTAMTAITAHDAVMDAERGTGDAAHQRAVDACTALGVTFR